MNRRNVFTALCAGLATLLFGRVLGEGEQGLLQVGKRYLLESGEEIEIVFKLAPEKAVLDGRTIGGLIILDNGYPLLLWFDEHGRHAHDCCNTRSAAIRL